MNPAILPLINLNLIEAIEIIGYFGLFIIILAESGLFVGFFLPGDSLIFTAGLLASQGMFNVWLLAILLAAGAILGDNLGYLFGRKVGPTLFSREDSFLFHKKHVERTRQFYAKHGPRAIVLARFLPVVRTFTPILAGVGMMDYQTFFKYNVVGAILWGFGLTVLGFFLGSSIPDVDRFLLPIILVVALVSFLPVLYEWNREKRSRLIRERNI